MHVWIGRQISKAFLCLPVSLRTCKTFFYFNALIISNIYGLYCGCAESTLTVVGFIQLIDIGLDFATWFKNKLKKIPKSKKKMTLINKAIFFPKYHLQFWLTYTSMTLIFVFHQALLFCFAGQMTLQHSKAAL